LVQRNVPVTFMKPASEVINDTLDPNEQPRIMKAIPVHPEDAPKAAPPPAKRPTPVHKGKKG
jgi:hypothetical protein